MKVLRVGLGVLVAGLFLYFVIERIELVAVLAALASADPLWILAAGTCLFVGYGIRAAR